MYKFELGAAVTVAEANKRDPGGKGTVTGRKHQDEDGKSGAHYRILIPKNPRQSSRTGDPKFRGFWYPESLVS